MTSWRSLAFRIRSAESRAANDPAALALQEDHSGVQRYQLSLGIHVDPYRDPSACPNRVRGTPA